MSGKVHARSGNHNERPTIAYLTINITEQWARRPFQGMVDMARERDVNLITAVCGEVSLDVEDPNHANVLIELLDPERVDGLIVWDSTVRLGQSAEVFESFRRRLDLPIVLIESDLEGYPRLEVDSYMGTREAVKHLIEVHGYRQIAFLGEYEGHTAFSLRHRAYVDTLAEFGLAVDEALVCPIPWSEEDRSIWVQAMVNAGVEAVVARTDTTAVIAIETLQAHGVRVPEDMAVVGFDDLPRARSLVPPLTTVRPSSYQMGRQAIQVMLASLQDELTDDLLEIIPSTLVVRESCGCRNPALADVSVETLPDAEAASGLIDQRETIAAQMAQTLESQFSMQDVERVLDAFLADLESPERDKFITALEHVLLASIAAQDEADIQSSDAPDLLKWQHTITVLYHQALPYLMDGAPLALAQDLWQQARVLIGDMTRRCEQQQTFSAEEQTTRLRDLGNRLFRSFSEQDIVAALVEMLPQIGIDSAYLALYEGPQPYVYPQPAPERARLALAFDAGERREIGPAASRVPTGEMLPQHVWPDRQYCFVVEALGLQERILGFALFEVGPRGGNAYQVLREEISSALHGAFLLEERRRAEEALSYERDLIRALMDSSPDYIFFKDRESRFLRTSRTHASQLLGLDDPEQAIGKTDFDFFSDREETKRFYDEEQTIMETGEPVIAREWQISNPATGEMNWVSEHKIPLVDEEGQVVGLIGISRDVTERRQAEEALERRATQLQTAAEISRAASSLLDPDELISRAVELIQERFGLYYAGLFLIEDDQAVLQAGTGEPGQQMVAEGHQLAVGGESMIGSCVADGEARIALDVGEEAVRFDNPHLPETRSELALPLTSRGQVIGALTIQSGEEAAFDEEDIVVLQTMASQIAAAIQNARLFERSQSTLQEMEATQQRYLRREWRDYTQDRPVSGYQQREIDAELVPLGNDLLPEARQALEEQRTIVQESEDGTVSKLIVPVVLRGQPFGALGFRGEGGADRWSATDVALAESLAEQFALAAENLRLLDETQRRAARERLTRDITDKMRRAGSINDIVQTAMDELFAALDTSRTFVQLGVDAPGSGDGNDSGSE